MNRVLQETVRYGAWATKALVKACRNLSVEQLNQPARGFGSILATLNHIVLCDADYLISLSGSRPAWLSDSHETSELDQIEARVDETTSLWEQSLSKPVDPELLLRLDEGEYECHASVVFTQALHHASAHREQIRSSLTDFDVKPPDIQPWIYALETGRAQWKREKK